MEMIEKKITMIIEELVGKELEFDGNTAFKTLNLSSFEFIQLIVIVEEAFEIEFEMDDLVEERFRTIADFAHRVFELISEKKTNSME